MSTTLGTRIQYGPVHWGRVVPEVDHLFALKLRLTERRCVEPLKRGWMAK